MKNMRTLPLIESLTFYPIGGQHIEDAKRDAIALATEYRCVVEFKFNEDSYRVRWSELWAQVKKVE
jgi:hypothetical protein